MQSPPLAERLRPKSLEDFIGQEHLIGNNGVLLKTLKNNVIPSIIFWGPPGVGKTTLANILANHLDRPFYTLSAINSGVKDVRDVITKAGSLGLFGKNVPILFIDEIHRFSKSQQDSLLNAVEKGIVTLIGATTENPSFEVISALLSRCQVYILKEQTKEDLLHLIDIALTTDGKVGIGTTSPSQKLTVEGNISGSGNLVVEGAIEGASKSFNIPHPTQPGRKLIYGSLEGPEHGVYCRGKIEGNVIELPEEWTGLVDEDTITVQLTSIGSHQNLYVSDIKDNKVFIKNGNTFSSKIKAFYFIQAMRKDIDKLQTVR